MNFFDNSFLTLLGLSGEQDFESENRKQGCYYVLDKRTKLRVCMKEEMNRKSTCVGDKIIGT